MESRPPEEPELGGPFDKRRGMPRRHWPIHPMLVDAVYELPEDHRDLWAERAAIMEFEAGMPRARAEWWAYGGLRPESPLKVYWGR